MSATESQTASAREGIERTRAAISSLGSWFDGHLAPLEATDDRDQFGRWRRELDAISELVRAPRHVRVALIGTTGAGKSTFLNALLEQEVLPVGVMHACTAFVTAVSFAPGPGYRLRVTYATRAEWQQDLDAFLAMLQPGEGDAEGAAESHRIIDVARKRVEAVFGGALDPHLSPSDVAHLPLPPEAEAILAGAPIHEQEFLEAKALLAHVRSLVRGENALWPLVREVSIQGPYGALSGGIELVDLPGLNDPNEARVEVTRAFLRRSPFVWLVFPMARGITADVRRILDEEGILRTLILAGNYTGLTMVGTKADDIDTGNAEQLGLPEDCELAELIAEYRSRTADEARGQLEEMIAELPSTADAIDTRMRMAEFARQVRVHTVSAPAYNKLVGIGRLRKDYGIDDVGETGIPGVREHLAAISMETGLHFAARSARARMRQLEQEIDLYFRAKGEAGSPALAEARRRFREQEADFVAQVGFHRESAIAALELHRRSFMERLDQIFAKSLDGVVRSTQAWQGIHWATLRAIVHRDGVFRSPSSGRGYDLNMDITEPLLVELPVSWERYFTDELGGVTNEFVVKIGEGGRHFCDKVAFTAELLAGKDGNPMESQLAWFRQKVDLLATDAARHVTRTIREGRGELSEKMSVLAKARMQPAYNRAKAEQGAGMKRRMLEHLGDQVRSAARPLYDTMQGVILEGIGDLELQLKGLYERLAQTALAQAGIVVNNASVDLDAGVVDPTVNTALKAMPRCD